METLRVCYLYSSELQGMETLHIYWINTKEYKGYSDQYPNSIILNI